MKKILFADGSDGIVEHQTDGREHIGFGSSQDRKSVV